MFRQLIIFHNKEIIFNCTLAKGLGMEKIKEMKNMLQNYLELPTPGKTFKQPISDHMIYHQGKGSLYFVFVADSVDKLNYLQEIITETIKKFKISFPIPETINESQQEREEFIEFLYEKQQSLLSKIAIMGPKDGGRTTLFHLLKSEKQKSIMNFAVKSPITIDKLSFEVWDFQLDDNFSLLWSKHISGADLIIFIFDASNYNLKVLNNLLNLTKKDGKYSRLLILANKRDLTDNDIIRQIKNQLKIKEIQPFSLDSPNAKETLINHIRNALKFKEQLPENFKDLKKEAKDLEENDNLKRAIQKYKELIKISNEYQNFALLNQFENKLGKLKKRREQQIELEKDLKRKKKFSAPDQKKFSGKIKVKALPSTKGKQKGPQNKKLKPKKPKIKQKLPKSKPKKKGKQDKKKLTKNDIKFNIPTTKKSPQTKKSKAERIESLKSEQNLSVALQKVLKLKDAQLEIDLCQQFIEELQENLDRPLSFEDIKIAADRFIKHEKRNN
ncbi:MAG: ADP-ribosylation factor-like protein [Promethearchaeia archaeon]